MQSDTDTAPSHAAQNDFLIGLLAVRRGLVTQAQLQEAVAIRLRSHPTPRLTDVLAEVGRIPSSQMLRIFELFCSLMIGSIAIRLNLIAEDQLFEALEIQEASTTRPLLGTVLIGLGYLSGESLDRILAEQETALTTALVPPAPAAAPRKHPHHPHRDAPTTRRIFTTLRRPPLRA
jgi:hypothetical protein